MPTQKAVSLGKQPRRPHYIAAWADKHGLSQQDLALAIGADKSNISRWFSGTCPSVEWQSKLASYFGVDIEALFRHPDDEWMVRFLQRRRIQFDRIKQVLEITFPDED